MWTTLNIALAAAAAVLLVPLAVLCAEMLASLLPARRREPLADRPAVAVVLPAHDEAGGLRRTLESISAQLRPGDRLLVVADNCTDATAEVVREHGRGHPITDCVEVVERTDAGRRGKGYALDHGVRHLERSAEDGRPPGVVIVIDADVTLRAGAIDALAEQVARTGRPAQAVYLMDAPPSPKLTDQVSRFAFTLRNLIRPVGLARLRSPCPLFGCGMAFPWETIKNAPLATGNLVEDMALGLDLAAGGHAPRLCEGALFIGGLPADDGAAKTQRLRWDRGHLRTMAGQVPRSLLAGVATGRPGLVVLALDAAVPPITLLLAASGAAAVAFTILALTLPVSPWPAVALWAGLGLLLGVCVPAVYLRHFRGEMPVRALMGVPTYLWNRLPAHQTILSRKDDAWVRTPRDGETKPAPPAEPGKVPTGTAE